MAETHVTSIPVRFQDIDAMGHVNNNKYPNFLTEARARYYREVIDYDLRAADTVVVHMTIDYHSEITHGDVVDIEVEVTDLGTSSLTMEYTLRVSEEAVSTAETVQVIYDNESGSSRPIPTDWRRRVEAHEGIDSA
jgi:acyl-CoA thioester hydrolase